MLTEDLLLRGEGRYAAGGVKGASDRIFASGGGGQRDLFVMGLELFYQF